MPPDTARSIAPVPSANSAPGSPSPARVSGRIRKLLDGFGFITDDAGGDHFFHRSTLRPGAWFHDCREGAAVTFTPTLTPDRRTRAVDVVLVDHPYTDTPVNS